MYVLYEWHLFMCYVYVLWMTFIHVNVCVLWMTFHLLCMCVLWMAFYICCVCVLWMKFYICCVFMYLFYEWHFVCECVCSMNDIVKPFTGKFFHEYWFSDVFLVMRLVYVLLSVDVFCEKKRTNGTLVAPKMCTFVLFSSFFVVVWWTTELLFFGGYQLLNYNII